MSIVLYVMRHGIAAEPAPGVSDADRALTAEGVEKTRRVAVGLQKLGVKPELIVSSPLRRAEETARLVGDVLAHRVTIEFCPPLAGGFSAEDIVKSLRPYRSVGELLLVGHQPDLGDLASYLLTGSAKLAPLPFKKAGVAAITLGAIPPRSAGMLEWFLTPSQLRAIGSSRS